MRCLLRRKENYEYITAINNVNKRFHYIFINDYNFSGSLGKTKNHCGNSGSNINIQEDYIMDSRLLQMVDEFESALMDRALKVMHVVMDEKRRYPMELNKSQCSEMLLGTKDTGSFDARFNCHKDFPRIPNAREKYPRDAVIEWYHENWRRTAI